MQRSKVLALIALLGMLVVGGAVGFSLDRFVGRDICSGPASRVNLRRYLAQELELTAAQRASVDSILDKRHRDMSAAFAPVRPALDSIRNAARMEISKVLTDQQRPRFQQLIEESKREDAANRK